MLQSFRMVLCCRSGTVVGTICVLLLPLLIGLSAACSMDRRQNRPADRFIYGRYDTADMSLPYRLSRPVQRLLDERFPLVVLLHGAGERGSDNEKTLKHFLPLLSREDFPLDRSYVLVPQCAEEYRWVEVDWKLPAHRMPQKPSKPLAATLELIDTLLQSEAIDPARIYIVGLSMGGFGVWDALARWPDRFAAGVAVCGGGDETEASAIRAPVWAFHGARDLVVSPARSRNMVHALRRAGRSVRYTEYADEAHGSWKPAFQEAELIRWLFSQTGTERRKPGGSFFNSFRKLFLSGSDRNLNPLRS